MSTTIFNLFSSIYSAHYMPSRARHWIYIDWLNCVNQYMMHWHNTSYHWIMHCIIVQLNCITHAHCDKATNVSYNHTHMQAHVHASKLAHAPMTIHTMYCISAILHCLTIQCITICYTTLLYNTMHYTIIPYITLQYNALRYAARGVMW